MRIRIWKYKNGAFTVIRAISTYRSLTYTQKFYDIGNFEFIIPPQDIGWYQPGLFVQINDFWGIAQKITVSEGNGNTIQISGPCIKWLMATRVTVANDTDQDDLLGYDNIAGDTETCMLHYVTNNAYNPAYTKRKIPFLSVSENLQRGTANDKYYSRFEYLSDVLIKLGKRAGLGWGLTWNGGGFTYSAVEGRDMKRHKLSVQNGKLLSTEYEGDYTNQRNTYYCTKSGYEFEDEALTQTYYTDDMIAEGYERIETAMTVSVDSTSEQYADMKQQAQKEMDNYAGTEGFNCKLSQSVTEVQNGDTVTILIPSVQLTLERQITEMTVSVSEKGIVTSAVFGEKYLTKFEKIDREMRRM